MRSAPSSATFAVVLSLLASRFILIFRFSLPLRHLLLAGSSPLLPTKPPWRRCRFPNSWTCSLPKSKCDGTEQWTCEARRAPFSVLPTFYIVLWRLDTVQYYPLSRQYSRDASCCSLVRFSCDRIEGNGIQYVQSKSNSRGAIILASEHRTNHHLSAQSQLVASSDVLDSADDPMGRVSGVTNRERDEIGSWICDVPTVRSSTAWRHQSRFPSILHQLASIQSPRERARREHATWVNLSLKHGTRTSVMGSSISKASSCIGASHGAGSGMKATHESIEPLHLPTCPSQCPGPHRPSSRPNRLAASDPSKTGGCR